MASRGRNCGSANSAIWKNFPNEPCNQLLNDLELMNSRAGYIDVNFNHGRILKTMEQNSTKSEILNGSSLSFTKSSSRYLKLVYYVLEF
jgi:hypothetical protein